MIATDARTDLAACLSPLSVIRISDEERTFHGTIRAPLSLAGPPSRLHGGLHPSARLLLPFERLTSPALVRESRLALDVHVRRTIALVDEVPIEGSLVEGPHGVRTLRTRTAGTDRLDAELRTGVPDDSKAVLARFRSLIAADEEDGDQRTLVGEGSLEFQVGTRLVTIHVDSAFAERGDLALSRFLGPGRMVDPTFTSAALDVIGAYALGMTLRSRLYTTHLAIVVDGSAPIGPGGFVMLGDRRGVDVAGSVLDKVEVDGVLVGEQRVEVLLADEALDRAYGHGFVSLVPVRASRDKEG